jgi:MEMO1 family protein
MAVERVSPEDIGEEQACGCIGIRALLFLARAQGLHATTLDLRNSGDTAGTPDRVVGYGAFSFV